MDKLQRARIAANSVTQVIATATTLAALAVGAIGAIWDIRHRRLPNLLCLCFAIFAVGRLITVYGMPELPGAAGHALLALVVGMALFKFGMIGGGDAKFYTAAALGLPLSKALPMLGWTSVTGLVLLLVMVAVRRIRGIEAKAASEDGSWTVPYGVAIFGGYVGATVIS